MQDREEPMSLLKSKRDVHVKLMLGTFRLGLERAQPACGGRGEGGSARYVRPIRLRIRKMGAKTKMSPELRTW